MKNLTTVQKNAIGARRVAMSILVQVNLPSLDTVIRFCSDAHTRIHAGEEWVGAGAMLDIKFPDEDATLEVHNAEITLNGLDVALISMVLQEPLDNSPVAIYCLVLDPDTYAELGTFWIMRGTLSNIRITPPSSSGG